MRLHRRGPPQARRAKLEGVEHEPHVISEVDHQGRHAKLKIAIPLVRQVAGMLTRPAARGLSIAAFAPA